MTCLYRLIGWPAGHHGCLNISSGPERETVIFLRLEEADLYMHDTARMALGLQTYKSVLSASFPSLGLFPR